MFCPNCGQRISEDSRFCEHCGNAVEAEQTPNTPQKVVTAPIPAAQSPQKRRGGFSKAVILVVVFAVIAAGVWFLKGWLEDGKPVAFTPKQKPSYTGSEAIASLSPEQDQQPVQGGAEEKKTNEIEETEGVENVENIDGIEEIDDDSITSFLTTRDRPTLDEFDWYHDVFANGVWSGANLVTELPYMLGGWKCYIVYDPYRNMDSYAQELANAEIETVQSGISLTVDWYQMYWEGEPPYDESDLEDSVFTGSYEDGEFYLTGAGNISLGSFYEYEGIYYGFGSLLTPDGITADFCLMR